MAYGVDLLFYLNLIANATFFWKIFRSKRGVANLVILREESR